MTEDKKKDKILTDEVKDSDTKDRDALGDEVKPAEEAGPEKTAEIEISSDTEERPLVETDSGPEAVKTSDDAKAEQIEEVVKSPEEPVVEKTGEVAKPMEEAVVEKTGEVVKPMEEAVVEKTGQVAKPMEEAAVEKSEEVVKPPTEAAAGKSEEALKPSDRKEKAPKPSKQVENGFTPHYRDDAGPNAGIKALLWLLLIAFGVGIIGTVIQAVFIDKARFALPIGITGLIWIAVMFPLWKKISLEAKVGLEASFMGVIMAIVYTVYQGELTFPGLSASILVPALLCLMLLVVLIAVWLVWPRFFWLPIVLSVIVLLGAAAPIWSLALGGKDLTGIIQCPDFNFWPYLAGWIMSQIILPFGVVLLVVLQIKNLFKPRYKKHAGFILWALGLALVWTVPLAALDRADQPVFPTFGRLADRSFEVPAPERKEEPPVTEVEDTVARTTETQPEQPAPSVSDLTEPAPVDTDRPASAETTETVVPTATPDRETAETSEETVAPTVAETQPAPSDTAPAPVEQADSSVATAGPAAEETPVPQSQPLEAGSPEQLRQRIEALETDVADLKEKIGKQDRLIQDLFIWLADTFREDAKARTRLPISERTPMMNMISPAPEESAPSDSPADQPANDQPGPSTDQPSPSTDQPGPSTDQPGPSAVQPGPSDDRPDPSKDSPEPSAEQPGPPTDQPVSPEDRSGPPAEQPDQPSDQTKPKDAA